mmetsp:Transcript_14041/g.34763  ORF Transcript_14041/g.34763 Transcript_14041/m.34763 type:complete len:306 (-) Transcript_14041:779-1696(-)|eukprot:CAMPEP_0178999128 /NCGR_PEP_ID=MMETSP0795-20121207/9881_1 /TAXON_ID=88552 /ORGANISM="Amoebophrya sp., Strain Ameob2" /LENGTH=305 /DNA_ID=CAMNT_0020691853 /DNA_START=46 /DNA_END=963 /DNA_ORIENTATION=+
MGGNSSKAKPPEQEYSAKGALVRLNFSMKTRQICGTSPGVEEKVFKNTVPQQIIDAARRNVQARVAGAAGGAHGENGPRVAFKDSTVLIGGPPSAGGAAVAHANTITMLTTSGERELTASASSDLIKPNKNSWSSLSHNKQSSCEWCEARDPRKLQEIWSEFFGVPNGRLFTQVQRKHTPWGCCALVPVLTVQTLLTLPTGFGCGHMFRRSKKRVLAWDADLRRWQAELNEKLLPYGLFVKTKSHCENPEEGGQREMARWLTVALTDEESKKLAEEDHVGGDVESCDQCGGVDEKVLCAHAPVGL